MTQNLYTLLNPLRAFVQRHHPIMFISFVGLSLAIGILSLYDVLTVTFETPDASQSTISSFDQRTVDKIKNLHDSSNSTVNTLVFPTPRANPFIEQ